MIKTIILSVLFFAAAPITETAPPPVTYGQILLHTADGATYVATGDASSFVFKPLQDGNFAYCMVLSGVIGLPPATNDRIFKDGFETVDICFTE